MQGAGSTAQILVTTVDNEPARISASSDQVRVEIDGGQLMVFALGQQAAALGQRLLECSQLGSETDSDDKRVPDLIRKAGSQLATAIDGVEAGASLPIDSSSPLSGTLEYLVPRLLARDHREWLGESLDGLYLSSARKSDSRSAVLTGLCILISDQTVTPFTLSLSMAEDATLSAVRIRLGEPGGGQLGISGPAAGSSEVLKRLWALEARLGAVDWTYDVQVDV